MKTSQSGSRSLRVPTGGQESPETFGLNSIEEETLGIG